MNELTSRARRFLDAQRAAGAPTTAQADRVRAAVDARLAAEAGGSPPTEPAGAKAAGAASKLALLKGGSLVAVLAVASWSLWPSNPAPLGAPPVALAQPPVVAIVASIVQPSVSEPVTAVIAPIVQVKQLEPTRRAITPRDDARPAAIEPDPVPAPDVPAVGESPPAARETPPLPAESELTLISRADDQLRSADTAAALATLERWNELYSVSGQMREEAIAARILALCISARTEEARTEARAYFAKHPQSPQRNRIERACANREPKE